MSKNRLVLHLAAVLTILFFAFLAISSGASTPKATTTRIEYDEPAAPTVVNTSQDTVVGRTEHQKDSAPVKSITGPTEKSYDALGLVFATSVTKYDAKGNVITSQESIVTLLLRESQKLGGNDIVNLRTDENTTTRTGPGVYEKTVTVTGSALAIKYRN